MDMQTAFNLAVMLIGGLGGWLLKSITNRLDELYQSEHNLRNKLQAVELLVAGSYVKHSDLKEFGESLSKRLDKFEDRLLANRP